MFQYLFPSLMILIAFSWIGRLFLYKGSLFDPDIAPGYGAFAGGDLLLIGAVLAAFIASEVSKRRGVEFGRWVLVGLLLLMLGAFVTLIPPYS
jgi:hypothetical protein